MLSLEESIFSFESIIPNKVAIITKKEQVTYHELCRRVSICIYEMKKRGIQEKEIVMVQAVSDCNFIVAYIALHCLNGIVVPIDRKITKESLYTIRDQLNVKYIIGDSQFLEKTDEVILFEELHNQNGEVNLWDKFGGEDCDIFDIIFTTGTTGQAKGVMTTRKSVIEAIRNEIEGAKMTREEVLLIPIPLNHSFGIGKMRAILFVGGTIVLQNGVSMVAELKNNLLINNCTAMLCVPSALEIIYRQAGENISEFMGHLHFIEVASAPFGIELKEQMRELLPNVHILNRYGSTETPASIYLDTKEAPDKLSSIGKPLSNVRVKIVDDEKNEIKSSPENIGKLAISGPMVMKGYYEAEDLTYSVLCDGWLYSKDLAYIDEDGYIYLMGRDDDVINTGGKKFSPLEVEQVLMKSKLLKECVIVGIDDPKGLLGKIPALAYVPEKKNLEQEEVLRYLRERIEKYKLPTVCIEVSMLPRNYMGKLDRKKVRELFG